MVLRLDTFKKKNAADALNEAYPGLGDLIKKSKRSKNPMDLFL